MPDPKRLFPRKKRDGFGLDSLILIISAIVVISIMTGVSKAFMSTLEDSYVSLTTTMPRFEPAANYTASGNATSVQNTTAPLLAVYTQ